MHVQRIAIIGTNDYFAQQAEQALSDNFNVSKYFSFSRFQNILNYNRPDVIVLDANNSVRQIKSMIASMRAALGDVPVILHTTSLEIASRMQHIQKEWAGCVLTTSHDVDEIEQLAVKMSKDMEQQHRPESTVAKWMHRLFG